MVDIKKYDKRYVKLALSCGSVGFGRIKIYPRGSVFLEFALMNNPGDIVYNQNNYKRDIENGKRNDVNPIEIIPENITRIEDITDEIDNN